MLIGATSLGWHHAPIERVFAELGAMGGECVELNGRPGQHDGLTLDAATASQVRRWAADAGLRITSIGGYNDFARRDSDALDGEVARLRGACGAAHLLEVPIVRTFSAEPQPGETLDTLRPFIVEGFRRAARVAESLGVTIAIENHGHLLNDGPALAALIAEVAAPNVRLTLDTGNFAWAGHNAEQVRADIAAALPLAASVHVKDGIWRGGDFVFVPAGEGELPLADVMRTLVQRGYDGPVCSEYEGETAHDVGTRRSIAYLKELRRGSGNG